MKDFFSNCYDFVSNLPPLATFVLVVFVVSTVVEILSDHVDTALPSVATPTVATPSNSPCANEVENLVSGLNTPDNDSVRDATSAMDDNLFDFEIIARRVGCGLATAGLGGVGTGIGMVFRGLIEGLS